MSEFKKDTAVAVEFTDISGSLGKVDIAIPPNRPQIKGSPKVEFVIRDITEVRALARVMSNEDEDGNELPTDPKYKSGAEFLRHENMYTYHQPIKTHEGKVLEDLGDILDYICFGKFNSYLVPLYTRAYFNHFGEEPAKNSRWSRVR